MMKHIASLSGGKDSTYQLVELVKRNYPLDEVVFFDTGWEFSQMYDHLNKLEEYCNNHGIEYTVLHPKNSFNYLMFDKPIEGKQSRSCNDCTYCKESNELRGFKPSFCENSKSRFFGENDDWGKLPWNKGCARHDNGKSKITHYGYSWCGLCGCRWGTTEKLKALDEYTRGSIVYVGIAADETARLQKERKENKRFPLAEWGITEVECLEGCYKLGYDWGGLYKYLDRVSCKYCALKNLKELRNIRKYYPDVWEELKDVQRRANRPYKGEGKSVFQLEIRFAFEEERIANGFSITNKEFYMELSKLLEKEV